MAIAGPFTTDPVALFAGIAVGARPGWLPGGFTIDPNMGFTAFALGKRAALDLAALRLPLWNHFEGLGTPLLGEMQSAALFPPTLLLLLPHGQMIEQAALQAVAGFGTYLFLRRFGLGATASLAGGLLFELNGTFAWLRNAIFNPIAFLPWLAYAIELLRAGARARGIGLGAVAGALAIYAGFPEVVYFYCLLLVLSASVRATSLSAAQAWRFGAGLAATAALAALIAAPALLAFAHFVAEAELGGHQQDLFEAAVLPPAAWAMHLLPYLYGPIAASKVPAAQAAWGGIGGYLGTMPALLALAGLIVERRRPEAWLLALWTLLSLGASHGVPILHPLFLLLPLAKIAAYSRYLDASWILACATLSSMAIDRLPSMRPRARQRLAAAAALLLAIALGAALVPSWPVVAAMWEARTLRLFTALSLAVAAALVVATLYAMRSRHAPLLATALLVAEAGIAFLLPFASAPRIARVDLALIDALRLRPGRFAIADGPALTPNFGAAFGLASLNWDDLPIPARTVAFALQRIDPAASAVNFHPPPGDRARRKAEILAHLPGYRAAGAATLLAGSTFFAVPLGPADGPESIAVLHDGDSVTATLTRFDAPIGALLVRVGTYAGLADGMLEASLCQAGRCTAARAAAATTADNAFLPFALPAPFAPDGPEPLRLTLTGRGGRHEAAIWMRGTGDARQPEMQVVPADLPQPVATTISATLFDLPGAAPYADAPGCRVTMRTRDAFETDCPAPSRLVRLEVLMRGWTATVDARPVPITTVPITPAQDTFQAIALPQGRATIAFRYDPPFVRAAVAPALVALALALWLAASGGGKGFASIRASAARSNQPTRRAGIRLRTGGHPT